jgi:hypothetical protein
MEELFSFFVQRTMMGQLRDQDLLTCMQTLRVTSRTNRLEYDIPRAGDILKNITITGLEASIHVMVLVGDKTVWNDVSSGGVMTIPITINLIAIGYHTARLIICTDKEPHVTADFQLFEDIEYRRGLSTTKWWWPA